MNSYLYIQSFFKAILEQSVQIQGRLIFLPTGRELNSDEFAQDLSLATKSVKFPVAAIAPPRSTGKFISRQDEWEDYTFNMYFLNTTYYSGDNRTSRKIKTTATSSKSVIEEWEEMKVAALDFLRVLQFVQKGNNTDSVNMLNSLFRLHTDRRKYIDPISFISTHRLSGVHLQFEAAVFTTCDISSYEEGGIVILPESDQSTFDFNMIVIRQEVLNIVNELGLTSYDAVDGETPAGAVNGINATFTTLQEFIPSSLKVYLNGVRQKIVEDYNTSGTQTINFVVSPLSTDVILTDYEINNN